MGLFKRRPTVVNAFVWTGGETHEDYPDWLLEKLKNRDAEVVPPTKRDIEEGRTGSWMIIMVNRVLRKVEIGDYLIKDEKDVVYPCKPSVFEEKYEKAD